MTSKHVGIGAAVLVADAVLLLIVGAAMWSEPPSSADEAVGKGLLALGAAVLIPAVVLVCVLLASRVRTATAVEDARSDWDPV